MFRMFMGAAAAVALLASSMAPAIAQGVYEGYGLPQGSYLRSCSNITIRGPILRATCNSPNGPQIRSRLNVNRCSGRDIVNYNGYLRCGAAVYRYGSGYRGVYGIPPGSYQNSCTNFSMNGPLLTARCNNPSGPPMSSTVNVNVCSGRDIVNYNGTLRCGGSYYQYGQTYSGGYGVPPPGSYQNSCVNAQMNGTVLSASCNSPNGGRIFSSLNVNRCLSQGLDIRNVNGYLRC